MAATENAARKLGEGGGGRVNVLMLEVPWSSLHLVSFYTGTAANGAHLINFYTEHVTVRASTQRNIESPFLFNTSVLLVSQSVQHHRTMTDWPIALFPNCVSNCRVFQTVLLQYDKNKA